MSNLPFKLKLADGTQTTLYDDVVRSTQLHSSELTALKAAVVKDAASPPAVDGSHLFVFERTALSLMDQESLVKGRLLDFVHERDRSRPLRYLAL